MRVHDLQAYRKMDVTEERISHMLELREILLSFQTNFNLFNASVVCAFLESISGLEPSSVITEPRYLKLVTVSSLCPFTLISVLMPLVVFFFFFGHKLGLLGTDLYAVGCEASSRRSTNLASSSTSPAKSSMSSAKRRLVIVLPPVLTVAS